MAIDESVHCVAIELATDCSVISATSDYLTGSTLDRCDKSHATKTVESNLA